MQIIEIPFFLRCLPVRGWESRLSAVLVDMYLQSLRFPFKRSTLIKNSICKNKETQIRTLETSICYRKFNAKKPLSISSSDIVNISFFSCSSSETSLVRTRSGWKISWNPVRSCLADPKARARLCSQRLSISRLSSNFKIKHLGIASFAAPLCPASSPVWHSEPGLYLFYTATYFAETDPSRALSGPPDSADLGPGWKLPVMPWMTTQCDSVDSRMIHWHLQLEVAC